MLVLICIRQPPKFALMGQAPHVLKRGVAIIVSGWAVPSFDVDGVPNPHVVGRHVIVPETGRHV
jgi:hypothetical protein